MNVGPGLVIRGTLVGCLFVAFLGISVTASAKSLSFLTAETQTTQAVPEVDAQPVKASSNVPTPAEGKNPQPKGGSCHLSGKFPGSIAQWCDLIKRAAGKYGVPAELIAAVMLQESGGNPLAYSSSGAVGLLQVMPRDGLAAGFACSSGPCFASRPTIKELQDPQFNLEYGAGMLANLLDRQGSWREALKSYGPANVGYYYADIVLQIYQNYGN